jgi:segregation and condensation protein A
MPTPGRQPPAYRIEVPAFSGPLDLLLHLIEREELDVTAISLARVTEQYLAQVEQLRRDKIEHLIDFLVIGARLLVIKSRALLPQSPSLIPAEEEEEDPAQALIRQLRLYRRYKAAAGWLRAREEAGLRTYVRVAPPPRLESKLDLTDITLANLTRALEDVLSRAETMQESVEVIQPRRFTIERQLRYLRKRLSQAGTLGFRELLSETPTRVEIAVTLLALLELIKRREITVAQPTLFGPIEVHAAALEHGEPERQE